MGKRKKKKTAGGGAFGRAKRAVPDPGEERDDLEERPKVVRVRPNAHQQCIFAAFAWESALNPDGAEDIQERAMARFEKGGIEPTAHFDALLRFDKIDWGRPVEERRAQLEEVLAIDPDCVDALLNLAYLEPEVDKAMPLFDEAIEAGRRKRDATDENPSLPESVRTVISFGYLHALHEYAEIQRIWSDFPKAKALYRELLENDPGDSFGARLPLFAIAITEGAANEAEALLSEMPSERSCMVLYGRAFLEFSRALEESPDFEADMESEEPFAKLPSPRLAVAEAALRHAILESPWTMALILDRRSLFADPVGVFVEGDPYESIDCARLLYPFCTAGKVPALWLCSQAGKVVGDIDQRRIRRNLDAFEEILDILDDADMDHVMKMLPDEEYEMFDRVSEQMVDLLLDLGAPRRVMPGRRRRLR